MLLSETTSTNPDQNRDLSNVFPRAVALIIFQFSTQPWVGSSQGRGSRSCDMGISSTIFGHLFYYLLQVYFVMMNYTLGTTLDI
jgi:hypothetical protein